MLETPLQPLQALNAWMMTPVHPTLYPFPWATTLHALRVSLAYRHLCKAAKQRRIAEAGEHKRFDVAWQRHLAGFLVMAWGGSFLSNYLLTQIPSQLLTVQPWLNYLSVHFATGIALTLFPAPSASLLDLCLPILDGATRTAATLGGLNLVLNHANPAVRSSLFLQTIIATLSACGGGISAFTLNVFDPVGWSFNTPPVLGYARLVDATDILAPLLAVIAFGVASHSHPTYTTLSHALALRKSPWLDAEQGRALVTLVIATCFWAKAVTVHLLTPQLQPTPKTQSNDKAQQPSTPSKRSKANGADAAAAIN
ncbi:hypothetical protein ACQY0O_004709 [Thecaphora frezii]